MNPGRFYVPNYIGVRGIPSSNLVLNNGIITPRNVGLFSRITNGFRSVNWASLLTNANKTLDVVNQTIPLVRQAGPVFNNMKNMFRIAKAFGNETSNVQVNVPKNNISPKNDDVTHKKVEQQDSAPNFFL